MGNLRKVGVIALVAALMVVLAVLRPAAKTPNAEANLGTPGGIAALPSAAPAVPGLSNQSIPAIIGTGQPGIVAVFCGSEGLPFSTEPCPDVDGNDTITQTDPNGGTTTTPFGAITFTMTLLYPNNISGPPALTFDANGDHTLTVSDNSGADMDSAVGVVTIRVDAAAATLGNTKGVNEIVLVTATDETGDARSVQIVVVDTILAFGPTGPLNTASQQQPELVSYHCDVLGRSGLLDDTIQSLYDPDHDGVQGLDDMYDALYAGVAAYDTPSPGNGYGSNTTWGTADPNSPSTLPDVWCGGNTPGALYDDFVTFQTDKGIFSDRPVGETLWQGAGSLARKLGFFLPPIVDPDCPEGKSVNVFDVDALYFWNFWLLDKALWANVNFVPQQFKSGCDADGWRNGVVTTFLLGNGDVGTTTITAQQGGGVGPPPRTVNVAFVGEPLLSLYLIAPTAIGVEGGSFEAVIVDSFFRPVANETVSCLLDPKDSGYIIWPQTGTTGAVTGALPGMVMVKILPTGKAVTEGGTLTLTCRMDRQASVVAIGVVKLEAFQMESVSLVTGCNPVAATWPDATLIDTVAKGVAPPEALDAIWLFDPESGTWKGFSAAAPEASDLASVNRLDAVFVCMNAPGTISRPKI